MPSKELVHVSVLKKEIFNSLITSEIKTVFDGTLGLGGHAELILSQFPQIDCYIGVDLDLQHLTFARKRLNKWKEKTVFFNKNFSEIISIIQEVSPKRPMAILLDLGLCSNQIDDVNKGFSFRNDGPLDMSFGIENKGACKDLLDKSSSRELCQIFREYGEEPLAYKLSNKIIENRKHNSINTTGDLRDLISENVSQKDLKKTLMRVFQALRIATNDELGHLRDVLEGALNIMESGDKIGIMSFHSLEDRIVKNFFKKNSKPITRESKFSLHEVVSPAILKLLTKKPIVPTQEEIEKNPRSRSVKFRIAKKI